MWKVLQHGRFRQVRAVQDSPRDRRRAVFSLMISPAESTIHVLRWPVFLMVWPVVQKRRFAQA
eukprot:11219128-Lingulodinium_polyedra.AAC.1